MGVPLGHRLALSMKLQKEVIFNQKYPSRAGQILKMVWYLYKTPHYHSIWLTQANTFTHPVKYSHNITSQVTSVYKQYQELDISS